MIDWRRGISNSTVMSWSCISGSCFLNLFLSFLFIRLAIFLKKCLILSLYFFPFLLASYEEWVGLWKEVLRILLNILSFWSSSECCLDFYSSYSLSSDEVSSLELPLFLDWLGFSRWLRGLPDCSMFKSWLVGLL